MVYSTAQCCSALPRNSSSEQERPVRSVVLIWSSSARVRPSAALRTFRAGSDRLRRPSRPKQHWNFDPAEKELRPLPVLRYDSGHRKRRFKFTIRRYNHPIRIAERIATLDVLSNGRLNWGSGKSSSLTEQMAFQNDLSTLHDEWLEALEIIPRMWREDVFSFQGHFFCTR